MSSEKNKEEMNTTEKDKFHSESKTKAKNKLVFFQDILEKINYFFNPKTNVSNLDLLETDLIKDEVEIKFDWSKNLIIFSILFFIAVVIVLESYLFLSLWSKKRGIINSQYLEKEVTYIKEEIKNIKEDYDKSDKFSKRLATASVVFQKHVYWTNLFSFLEANTLKNNYYKSFSGDINGNYILPAVTNDVRAISFQSKVFLMSPLVLSSSVDGEEIINDEATQKTFVNFNFNFSLDKSIFN
ncbi:MAG: hypothetical protein WC928_03250 [Patescibacteria group bacterium]|jgi:hypothetical protein